MSLPSTAGEGGGSGALCAVCLLDTDSTSVTAICSTALLQLAAHEDTTKGALGDTPAASRNRSMRLRTPAPHDQRRASPAVLKRAATQMDGDAWRKRTAAPSTPAWSR
ncbi:hypothetical protein BU14_0141s0016 [Porphyra umbilicalis]|uniref:Uncharacterized protein n=1 Tax=Porphyra umbilicalis TaxID=2786 RepID=A0A1X6P9R1_PORUM|nr:hypothetical protein BU14_0141s0016 [Porphyra umbilicalis]|eukprot:OSX77632.1 hypothetical protein BU14_0141s0016 [Porphyra umbilicalis]